MTNPLLAPLAGAARRIGAHAAAASASTPMVLAAAAGTAALVLGPAGVGVAASRAEVVLEVDGVSRPVSIWGGSVREALANAGVQPGDHDLVQPAVGQSLDDGDTVIVRTANPYTVVVDGTARTVWSTSSSADAILADTAALGSDVALAADRSNARGTATPLVSRTRTIRLNVDGASSAVLASPGQDAHGVVETAGVRLSPLDRVRISTDEAGTLSIDVTRVQRGQSTTTVEIPFTETVVEDGGYFEGESLVTTPGVPGTAVRTVWEEVAGGQATTSAVLSEQTVSEPSAQIRSQGTKQATAEALILAGIDPKAQLEAGTEPDGTTSTRYRAKLGTLSTDAEINAVLATLSDPAQAAAAAAAAQSAGVALDYSGEDPKAIARVKVAARGWSDSEFQCLVTLWTRESHWDPYAENASSGAYGIPQALPGSKMASAGADWRTNPATQIEWGLGYIAGRYGTPCSALGHSNSVGWY